MVKLIKVKLESLDGKVITARTGKTSVMAETPRLPVEGKSQIFLYLDEDCDSPGISIATDGIEQIGNEIKFYDLHKRPFKITLL